MLSGSLFKKNQRIYGFTSLLSRFVRRNSDDSKKLRKKFNVTILGAGGIVGQFLGLLLKISPTVDKLKLYDVISIKGTSEDLSHIPNPVRTYSYTGPEELAESLEDTDIVVITAGRRRLLGMSLDELFTTNATIVRDLVEAVAIYSPKALIAILTSPLNSMVPVACSALRKLDKLDARKVFGITTIDMIRAMSFLAEVNNMDPRTIYVPVVGGHSEHTIVPLFSRVSPPMKLDKTVERFLTIRVQEAGDNVLAMKGGTGTSNAGPAYAAARFVTSLCRGLAGEKGVIECAYVHSNILDIGYFSNELELGRNGIENNMGIGKVSETEQNLIETSKSKLRAMIIKGEQFSGFGSSKWGGPHM